MHGRYGECYRKQVRVELTSNSTGRDKRIHKLIVESVNKGEDAFSAYVIERLLISHGDIKDGEEHQWIRWTRGHSRGHRRADLGEAHGELAGLGPTYTIQTDNAAA